MSADYHREPSFDVFRNNPVFAHLLGLSPVLAISTTVTNGIAMGLATSFVLIFSTLCVSILRAQLNSRWRFLYFMLILGGLTSLVDILMQWTHFPLYRELGIYVPLICCNFAILINLETMAYHNDCKKSLVKAALLACGYLFALILLSSIRELLANGSLLENWQLLLPGSAESPTLREAKSPNSAFGFAAYQPAALIILGLLVAAWNVLSTTIIPAKFSDGTQVIPVKRERVTGKIGAKT